MLKWKWGDLVANASSPALAAVVPDQLLCQQLLKVLEFGLGTSVTDSEEDESIDQGYTIYPTPDLGVIVASKLITSIHTSHELIVGFNGKRTGKRESGAILLLAENGAGR